MKTTIENLKSLSNNHKLLLAVSGGVDSMVLLNLMIETGSNNFGVIHINHGIREESESEFDYIEEYCDRLNITFHGYTLDLSEAEDSIELAARNARYSKFNECMIQYEYNYLVLAHHQGDRIETLLYNFMRGSGVHGLANMKAIDERGFVRPLLGVTKNQLIEYANENDIIWFEDYTNQDNVHDRNWIRNEIIPSLESRREGLNTVLSRSADYFEQLSDYLKSQALEWLDTNSSNDFLFDSRNFLAIHPILQGEILRLIWSKRYGSSQNFSTVVVEKIVGWLKTAEGGSVLDFSHDDPLTIRKHQVYFVKPQS